METQTRLGEEPQREFAQREDFIRGLVKTTLDTSGLTKALDDADKSLKSVDDADKTDYDDEVG